MTALVDKRSSPGETAGDEQFRLELRMWLSEHPPPRIEGASTVGEAAALREWQRTLHAGGWVAVHWPAEYGGRGASVTQVAIYNEELARAGAPQLLGRVGITLVGPTLVAHGTGEQRRRWIARILDGGDVWCQLFSEPDAGSDLAALSTRAEKRDGVYVVNGQKVWSSHARFADWGIALVRTDPDVRTHQGISMLAIPMTAAGVEIRPLRQITGESEFNEVFLDGVEVPVDNRIGPEHDGWRVANTTLANERGASFIWRQQVSCKAAIDRLVQACGRGGRAADPVVRQRLAQSWIDVEIFRLHNERTVARLAHGGELGAESSVVKLWWAEVTQRLYETAIGVLGPDAIDLTAGTGRWAHEFLASRANSIQGGTSEIQRNIIGERLLGLPREPRQ
ncbi:MAG TPA: acyl-CoA dehydrogenase family protein [Acidimicrobiia bacterium]|nr:acyl-CoA dehydrogenase family protein [Acidimicrobiia bacterium]